MKQKKVKRSTKKNSSYVRMLPIDERLIPDVFSFSHVKGIARLFLQIEIAASVIIVLGTLTLVFLRMLRFY